MGLDQGIVSVVSSGNSPGYYHLFLEKVGLLSEVLLFVRLYRLERTDIFFVPNPGCSFLGSWIFLIKKKRKNDIASN